jgi:hypothetical protein
MVGAGQEVYQWPITVDTLAGRVGEDGQRLEPRAVDPVTLHDSLSDAACKAAIPRLSCEYRVYADGQGLFHRHNELLANGVGPPKVEMSPSECESWLKESRPSSTTIGPTSKA